MTPEDRDEEADVPIRVDFRDAATARARTLLGPGARSVIHARQRMSSTRTPSRSA